jgi:hypothetical protein
MDLLRHIRYIGFAFFSAPFITMAAFWLAMALRWEWLGYLLIGIGSQVQKKLVELGLASAPQTGGHMPDFGFQIAFDTVAIFLLLLAIEYGVPKLMIQHLMSKSRKA